MIARVEIARAVFLLALWTKSPRHHIIGVVLFYDHRAIPDKLLGAQNDHNGCLQARVYLLEAGIAAAALRRTQVQIVCSSGQREWLRDAPDHLDNANLCSFRGIRIVVGKGTVVS